MDSEEVKYWIGFGLIYGIGAAKFALLEDYFGELGRAWHASPAQLRASGLDAKSVEAIHTARSSISLETEIDKLRRYRVRVLTHKDTAYPARLREIDYPPPLLYVRGTLLSQDENSVAIVGTRHMTTYGQQAAEYIATDMAHNGITVVSGLARGIDSVAHRAALDAGGRTIAVAACGVDMVYPSEHVELGRRIVAQGALVSEFPLGTKPKAEHFPQRNRVMSGISLGVLVVEAGTKSGSLITAHFASEQNREVFAIPGNIYSHSSQGTNALIQEGAKLVRNCTDIMEELNLNVVAEQLEMRELVTATDTETLVLSHLSKDGSSIDDVCQRSGLPVSTVSGLLTMLELKGLARQVGNANYAPA
ncbi:MAG: DNA-processing protein DprA [Chloroflexota bacterium]|nr:DNA-processing protein DprA [Chloroflexota bacterium]